MKPFASARGETGDISPSVNAAIKSLPQTGGTILFPAGLYQIGGEGIIINRSDVTLIGEGAETSILRRIGRPGPLLQTGPSGARRENLVVKDLCFDGNRPEIPGENTSSITLSGSHLSKANIAGCKFVNSPAVAIALNGIDQVKIDRCLFRGPGDAFSTGVVLTRLCSNVSISGSRFLYLHDGLIVDTGNETNPTRYRPHHIKVTNNYFDLAWWLLKPTFVGDGQSVSYTANSLTDRNASFKSLSLPGMHNVRVMPVKQAGRAQYEKTTLNDSSARFQSNGVRRGDIIRAQNIFAVVAAAKSETSLEVEEWLSDEDRSPSSHPELETPYTVYGVVLGEVRNFTSDRLETARWWDFDGRTVTPDRGTRYEVLGQRPNYALHAEAGARDMVVSHNSFRRGWSDQISIWGDRANINNNHVEDGEDMGITLHGTRHRVAANEITHQGAGGIWLQTDDSTITDNRVSDSQWVNNFNDIWLGDIMVNDGDRNLVANNVCRRLTSALAHNGIVVAARKRSATGNIIRNNISDGHLKSDVRLESEPGFAVKKTVLEKNTGKIVR